MAITITQTIPESIEEGKTFTMTADASGAVTSVSELDGPFTISFDPSRAINGKLRVDAIAGNAVTIRRDSPQIDFRLEFSISFDSNPTVAHTILAFANVTIGVTADGRWVYRGYGQEWFSDIAGGGDIAVYQTIYNGQGLSVGFGAGSTGGSGAIRGEAFGEFAFIGNADFPYTINAVREYTTDWTGHAQTLEMRLGFGAEVVPADDYDYTWVKDSVAVSSGKTYSKIAEKADAGAYSVVVTAGGTSNTSAPVTLNVTNKGVTMSDLDRIVKINISRKLTTVGTKDMSTILLLSEGSYSFPTTFRAKIYASLEEVSADFGTTTNEYLASQAIFSYENAPSKLVIGKKATTESMAEALNAISDGEPNWYGLVILDNTTSNAVDIVNAGTWCKANKRFLFTCSADPLILSTNYAGDTGASKTIAMLMNEAGLNKSALIFSGASNSRGATDTKVPTGYADAVLAVTLLSKVVGSYTACFKPLSGVTPDGLSGQQVSNSFAKNCNVYHTVGGANVIEEGRVPNGVQANGEWIDTEIGIDWFQARLQESVYSLLVSEDKVPYTDAGISQIESVARGVCETAVSNGFLGNYQIFVKKASECTPAEKKARKFNGVRIRGYLAGAIHATELFVDILY